MPRSSTSTSDEMMVVFETRKTVDGKEYAEACAQAIASLFNLSSASKKALEIVFFASSRNQRMDDGSLLLDNTTRQQFCQEFMRSITKPTFYRGLQELRNAGVICRSDRSAFYKVQPQIIEGFTQGRLRLLTIYQTSEKTRPSGRGGVSTLIEKKAKDDVKPLRVVHEDGTVDDKTGDLFGN